MSYSEVSDLLIDDTRLDGVVDLDKMVKSAADEIDALIGRIYVTPVTIADPDGVGRPTVLFLKTINNHLATGRIILSVARVVEHNQLDALGAYYVKMALNNIELIVTRQVDLAGAQLVVDTSGSSQAVGPQIINGDSTSYVDLFYGRANPHNWEHWNPFNTPRRGDQF